jgi:hypothetical protein
LTLSSGTATRQHEVYGPLQGGGAHKLNVLYATSRNGPTRGKRLPESKLAWDFATDVQITSIQYVATHGLNYSALLSDAVRGRGDKNSCIM